MVLNLLGMLGYNPSRPWVFKVRLDGSIAVDLYFYIDDGRSTVSTVWDYWKASRIMCCTLIHHGYRIQKEKEQELVRILVSVKSGKGVKEL